MAIGRKKAEEAKAFLRLLLRIRPKEAKDNIMKKLDTVAQERDQTIQNSQKTKRFFYSLLVVKEEKMN